MRKGSLDRRVNILSIYAFLSSVAIIYLLYISVGKSGNSQTINELTVKRINVVSEDDKLRMVISNETRQHNGVVDGIELPPREREQGIIFFNSEGDECGGLVYDGNQEVSGMVFSVDQFKNDQIMQLQYTENTKVKSRKYGLQLWDYPKENSFSELYQRNQELQKLDGKEAREKAFEQIKADSLLAQDRMFVGKTFDNEVGIFIRDQNGNRRIKIYVDKAGNPRIESLDEKGVQYQLLNSFNESQEINPQ